MQSSTQQDINESNDREHIQLKFKLDGSLLKPEELQSSD